MEDHPPHDDRRRLLAVCTLPPWPVRDGYSLRVFHLLRGLARSWSITLVAPAQAKLGPLIPETIARHIPVALEGHGLTYPWRFDPGPLREAVAEATARHDPACALVWPGAESLWFGRPRLPPAVMDMIDCNTLEFIRGARRADGLRPLASQLREAATASVYGALTLRGFRATACVGGQDAAWLRATGLGGNVHIVPNGVDIPTDPPPEDKRPTVSFVGTLNFEPNVVAARWMAEAIWPLVHAALPDARLMLAGRNPVRMVAALAQRPGIEIHANVPDMAALLGRSWVSVAPMRSGAGIKNKVLEAWACARPVAMTPIARNGLPLPPDHRHLVQARPEALAAAIVGLLTDAAGRRALGASALAAVRTQATWEVAAARIDTLLRAAADAR